MQTGQAGRRKEPLHVWMMALVLALAAFAGAALGLVWQSSGLGDDPAEERAEEEPTKD
ncbi:hypothetical protein FHS61_000432 [Altererythrobacter atlanticus]|uniref:Uncharacterized protein n=1 Tax=Croceibacterium atlanticum TaxID=1267766 RepID=A0A0F7KTT9_9SPHN|nr:hypothetical protein [Croceibacterium atlanticum]AKH42662.1 hypothetical protein WYH_01626 [Croceibacterium atlanticum]MBB5731439.1 hypothetical protein [Croceibacterium atlanticum]